MAWQGREDSSQRSGGRGSDAIVLARVLFGVVVESDESARSMFTHSLEVDVIRLGLG